MPRFITASIPPNQRVYEGGKIAHLISAQLSVINSELTARPVEMRTLASVSSVDLYEVSEGSSLGIDPYRRQLIS